MRENGVHVILGYTFQQNSSCSSNTGQHLTAMLLANEVRFNHYSPNHLLKLKS